MISNHLHTSRHLALVALSFVREEGRSSYSVSGSPKPSLRTNHIFLTCTSNHLPQGSNNHIGCIIFCEGEREEQLFSEWKS